MATRTPPVPTRASRAATVAMADGPAREAVVAMLVTEGLDVGVVPARGSELVAGLGGTRAALVVVELSRLGEVGLRGLAALALELPDAEVVLLLPGGLGGPTAHALGITAVLAEEGIADLRAVVRETAARRQPA